MMAAAKVTSMELGEMVVKNGFTFPEKVLEKVLAGDRSVCMCCGEPKSDPNVFIRRECFQAAEENKEGRGKAMAEAARSLYEDRGGEIEYVDDHPRKTTRIDDDLFDQIVKIGIGHLVGNPGSSFEQIVDILRGNFRAKVQDIEVLRTAAATAQKVYLGKMNQKKKQEEAEVVVTLWYDENPEDLRDKYRVAADIMELYDDKELDRRVVEQTVFEAQKPLISDLCNETVEIFFQENPENVEHPSELCKKILAQREAEGKFEFPEPVLRAVLYKHQKPVIERLCHDEAKSYFQENLKDLTHPGEIAQLINIARADDGKLPLQVKILTAIVATEQEKIKKTAWEDGQEERDSLLKAYEMEFGDDPNRRKGPKKPGSSYRRGKGNGGYGGKGGTKKRDAKGHKH